MNSILTIKQSVTGLVFEMRWWCTGHFNKEKHMFAHNNNLNILHRLVLSIFQPLSVVFEWKNLKNR